MSGITPHHHIFVITGPVQGGKTTFTTTCSSYLRDRGARVSGFVCPGYFREGRRAGFQLVNIASGESMDFGSVKATGGWQPYRRFYFNPQAFDMGKAWIEQAMKTHPDLIVIDEVGPMELENRGWSGLLDLLAELTGQYQVWVVREGILREVLDRWKIPEENVFLIHGPKDPETTKQLMNRVLKYIT